MITRRSLAALMALPLSMATLTGCGGAEPNAAAPTITQTVVATQTVTETVTVSVTPSSEVTQSELDEESGPSELVTSTPIEAVTVPPVGTPLTLADFFLPEEGWVENRFDIADRKDVQGIAHEVCDNTWDLELRLANEFDTLSFVVGQSNDSIASSALLTVEVVGNNEQIEIREVPFNKLQPMEIPVAAVNALKINLYIDGGCDYDSIIGVLSDVVLT